MQMMSTVVAKHRAALLFAPKDLRIVLPSLSSHKSKTFPPNLRPKDKCKFRLKRPVSAEVIVFPAWFSAKCKCTTIETVATVSFYCANPSYLGTNLQEQFSL